VYKLLTRLKTLCPDDGYKIIEWTELGKNKEDTTEQLNELADLELIKIKYMDADVVCVSITAGGRVLKEKEKITKPSYPWLLIWWMVFMGGIIGGFLGALLGSILYN